MAESRNPQRSFWDKHNRGDGQFLNKAELANTGETFTIRSVRTGRGNYGEQWYLVVESENRETPEGIDELISFPRTEHREEMFKDLKAALDDGELITAKVVSYVNKRGEIGYDIAPVDDHENVPF